MAYRGQQTIPGAPALESVRKIQEAQEYGVKGMKWGTRREKPRGGRKVSQRVSERAKAAGLTPGRITASEDLIKSAVTAANESYQDILRDSGDKKEAEESRDFLMGDARDMKTILDLTRSGRFDKA